MNKLSEKYTNLNDIYKTLCQMVTMDKISPFVEVATTACAVISISGNVYYGVNLKTDCGLGFCSERNALSTMMTAGETQVETIMCIDRTKTPRLPCGACREFIAQINPKNLDCQIINSNDFNSIKLKDLLPQWWGHGKIARKN